MAIDNTNSQRISTIMYELSDRAKDYIQRTEQFIKDEIEPVEADFWHEVHRLNVDGDWTKWQWPAMLETLKAKAKAAVSLYKKVFAPLAPKTVPAAPEPNPAPAPAPLPC